MTGSMTAGPRLDRLDELPAMTAWRGCGRPAQIRVLTASSVRSLLANRRLLLIGSFEPLLMLLVFGQIFAGITRVPGFPADVGYTEFLVPALMVNGVVQAAVHAGSALTQDMRDGLLTRMRTMPVWPGGVLVGRSLAGLVRAALQLVVLLVLAFTLFGFHPPGGLTGLVAAAGLALVVGWSLGWIFIALACWLRQSELTQTLAGMAVFPLFFASSAFVPVSVLPGWLQAFARVNPMTYGIQAARDLTLAQPVGSGIVVAVATSAVVALSAAWIAVRGYARST